MGAFEIVMGVLLILICAALMLFVEMQEGKGGMNALTGQQSESFGRNAGKTLDSSLKTLTKYATAALMVIIVLINVVHVYF